MIIQQISIFLEDKTGSLERVTSILAQHGISMSAFCVADATDYGILRMVVSSPETAVEVLRANNLSANTTDVVCIKMNNVAGALNGALKVLSANGISIDYMYAFTNNAASDDALAVIHSSDAAKAAEVLQANNIELVGLESIK